MYVKVRLVFIRFKRQREGKHFQLCKGAVYTEKASFTESMGREREVGE